CSSTYIAVLAERGRRMGKTEEKADGVERRHWWCFWRRRRRGCGGAWRAEVEGRIGELEGRVKAVRGGQRRKETVAQSGKGLLRRSDSSAERDVPGWETVAEAVDDSICRAKRALRPLGLFGGICAWWSGSAITTAWEAVHV